MINDMTFNEWMQYKKKHEGQESEIERVDRLKAAFYAIDKCCFNGELNKMKIWYLIPEYTNIDAVGLYTGESVLINRTFYHEHGLDYDVINVLFHELVHAYCDAHSIHDYDDGKHLKAFDDVCRDHGGMSIWVNDKLGYSDTRLNENSLSVIRQELLRRRK